LLKSVTTQTNQYIVSYCVVDTANMDEFSEGLPTSENPQLSPTLSGKLDISITT